MENWKLKSNIGFYFYDAEGGGWPVVKENDLLVISPCLDAENLE